MHLFNSVAMHMHAKIISAARGSLTPAAGAGRADHHRHLPPSMTTWRAK